jgi:2-polyprenyl-3-methyl-5-hydroxy-6-metoxy-1,4-benzoquinol methylase
VAVPMGPDPDQKTVAERVVDDVGGALTVGLAYIGVRLGLFSALAASGPTTSLDLARRIGLAERYVREWLRAMVASRYVEHDPQGGAYFLTPEQVAALVDEGSRTFAAGAFQFALPSLMLTPRLMEVFKTGGGIPFGELPAEIPAAIARMHRPWFDHLLVKEWLAGAPGLVEALGQGISVLDVGCGAGRSTVAMAKAFPHSTFLGIDPHEPSIAEARALAGADPLANLEFSAQSVESLADAHESLAGASRDLAAGDPRRGRPAPFDLIVAIDCVHDMPAPISGLRAMGAALSARGSVFWSEPSGSREPLENRNPQGKLRSNLSPFHCLTISLAAGGAGLGTLIGEAGARELAEQAGFGSFEKLRIDSPAQQFFLLRDFRGG